MEKKRVPNLKELLECEKRVPLHRVGKVELTDYTYENLIIDFDLKLPIDAFPTHNKNEADYASPSTHKFNNCEFLKKVTQVANIRSSLEFTNGCRFQDVVKLHGSLSDVKFKDCIIQHLDCEDAVFGSKNEENKGLFKLYTCQLYEVNFRNTKFYSLANFFRSTFHNPVTFNRTRFYDTAVLSAVTFKENVLFSYAVINKSMLLRGTFPEKGFDLSLAIIRGDLSLFNFKMNDFKTYNRIHKDVNVAMEKYDGFNAYINAYDDVYEDAVSNKHLIPIENKRETYRILKNQLENQKNYIGAVSYAVKERRTYLIESWRELKNGVHFFNPISNMIVLSLNGLSNWFGQSYIQGALFTILIGGLFFTLALSYIGSFEFTWNYEQWQWEHFVQFLNPTHRFDYMKAVDPNPKTWFFIWDFIGRILVGYGIYQTIQAFRKFR